jgi:hypothetical protein
MDDAHADAPFEDEAAPEASTGVIRYYFVDETGDGNIFNHRKEIVIGRQGCSVFFILGLLDVADPNRLENAVSQLRAELLADPYLAKIPSMQPDQRKTALAFHAKDDCPEVRREVFRMLMQHDLRFFALVRDKRVIAQKVREFNTQRPAYRYQPNQLYDRCVSRLFRDRLHKDAGYTVYFSKRGNRSRTEAFRRALEQARANFRHRFKVESTAPIEIQPDTPARMAGLQAVDYFLWALQRLYERAEERYWEYVAGKVSLVHDVDDTRTHEYGEYYTKRNPLTAAKCARKEPGI